MQSILAKIGGNSTFKVDIEVKVGSLTATEEPARLTVEDVKKEFYDYLDALTLSPGLSSTPICVNITDAAFEKMLVDPEYKQRMMELCARDLCDPDWVKLPPTGINITIDADCDEEYLATSWNHPEGAKNVNPEGFWTRRAKKNKADRNAQEQRTQEKREMMAFLQERAEERKRLNNEFFQSRPSRQGIDAYAGAFAVISDEAEVSNIL